MVADDVVNAILTLYEYSLIDWRDAQKYKECSKI